jgi:hypothetical protein
MLGIKVVPGLKCSTAHINMNASESMGVIALILILHDELGKMQIGYCWAQRLPVMLPQRPQLMV